MSPASFFSNTQSPIGTPARAPGSNGLQDSTHASLWARVESGMRNTQDVGSLLHELMVRYEYVSQEYQRLSAEQGGDRDTLLALETENRSMKMALDRDPFVVVLIDGDGMIFRDEFIRDGENGGRRAAVQLHAAIADYIERENPIIPIQSRIFCYIWANVKGLAEVLVRTGVIEQTRQFEDFVQGFTSDKGLFSFANVGPGKDRADKKVIEHFKAFVNNLHCRQIFFGCSHDNGYARTLEEYMTDGVYRSKVTLLEGVPFEKELLVLPYRTKKFAGIFRESKLSVWGGNGVATGSPAVKSYNMLSGLPTKFPPPPSRTANGTPNLLLDSPVLARVAPSLPRTPSSSTLASDGMPAIKPVITGTWAAKASLPAPPVTHSPTYKPANREEIIARNRMGQRVDPPCRDYDKSEVDRLKKVKLCNVHFLRQECPYGHKCTHLHNYKPTDGEIATLRLVARMAPCQNGSVCQDIKCIYGHRCPAPPSKTNQIKGTKTCIFGEMCKFPPELHDIDCNVVKTLVVR